MSSDGDSKPGHAGPIYLGKAPVPERAAARWNDLFPNLPERYPERRVTSPEETLMRRARCFGIIAAVLLWWTPNAPADFVVNGGFESGATSGVLSPSNPGDLIYVFGVGGQTNIGGWTVSESANSNGSSTPLSVLVVGSPPQYPASGKYALDFDPFWNVTTGALLGPTVTGTLPQISQVIDLPAGQYVLSFDAAVEQPNPNAESRLVSVTLAGAASLLETPTTSRPDNVGYDHFSYDFTSTGGAVTLTFTPDDFSAQPNFMLDNVSINSVPEPSSLMLLGTGGLVLTFVGRKKKGLVFHN